MIGDHRSMQPVIDGREAAELARCLGLWRRISSAAFGCCGWLRIEFFFSAEVGDLVVESARHYCRYIVATYRGTPRRKELTGLLRASDSASNSYRGDLVVKEWLRHEGADENHEIAWATLPDPWGIAASGTRPEKCTYTYIHVTRPPKESIGK
ncbi:hypothetical protein FIBSPDRAFT_1006936 [Athelia psychrophila]|uniref:Uncharacterized protein n=1 Tax=Athelia psychrophila TaxID=1759441 RepID=A0A167VFV6_9AGAM|nr:hypothetical protein FIBSPDRAFT_1006936 [Fibularhizoctonia sp. CBS 109695]